MVNIKLRYRSIARFYECPVEDLFPVGYQFRPRNCRIVGPICIGKRRGMLSRGSAEFCNVPRKFTEIFYLSHCTGTGISDNNEGTACSRDPYIEDIALGLEKSICTLWHSTRHDRREYNQIAFIP